MMDIPSGQEWIKVEPYWNVNIGIVIGLVAGLVD